MWRIVWAWLAKVVLKLSRNMSAFTHLVPQPVTEPVAADFTMARILVNVNWQTVLDTATGEETRFWHRPLEYLLTRRHYIENPNVLFELLRKLLPNRERASVLWIRGREELVFTSVWPYRFPDEPELMMAAMRDLTRAILGLNDQDLPESPVTRCVNSFWLIRKEIL